MHRLKAIILLLLITPLYISNAQPLIQVKNYSLSNGLSHSKVEYILQDKKGFLWIGTWNGLNRFDGYNFKYYNSNNSINSVLVDNRINFIAENTYGNLWCRTYTNQIYLFDTQKEIFHNLIGQCFKDLYSLGTVSNIICLDKGITWITFYNGDLIRIVEDNLIENYKIQYFDNQHGKFKDKTVLNIKMDHDGDEWVFTDKGPVIFGNKTVNTSVPFNNLIEDNKRLLLLSEKNGLAEYNYSSKTVQSIPLGFSFNKINCYKLLKNSEICMGTDNGIIIYNTISSECHQYDIKTNDNQSNNILSIYEDTEQDLWLFTSETGIFRLTKETYEIQHLNFKINQDAEQVKKEIHLVNEDEYGTIWVIPNNNNLCYYDRELKKLKGVYSNPEKPNSFFKPEIARIKIDNRGFLWYINPDSKGITNVSFLPNNYNLIDLRKNKYIRSILVDHDNYFWIGSRHGGVALYDSTSNFLGYLSEDGSLNKEIENYKINPYCIFEDSQDNIWIGTKYHGIYLLTRKSKYKNEFSINHYSKKDEDTYSLNDKSIYSIFEDKNQRIWIGTFGGGLNLVERKSKNKIKFINKDNELNTYPKNYCSKIRFITEVNESVIMIATTDGLLTFSSDFNNLKDIDFHHNYRKNINSSGLSNNDIMHIFTDSRGNTYLSTASGGINKIISKNLLSDSISFKAFTTENGLSPEVCLSMVEDNSGLLWIISENTLLKFDPETESFETLSHPKYLNSLIFSEATPLIHKNNIFIGSEIGILKLIPQNIQINNYVPPVVFTSISIQGSNSKKSVAGSKEIFIDPDERNVTFQFTAIDYANPDNIHYAYRMEGYEKNWNYADNNRSASYLKLPGGNFNFQVRSTNSNGIWVNNTESVSLYIKPKIWETPWAWIIYSIIFSILVFISSYTVIYIYKLRNQVIMEKKLARIKLRFFTDISHELRTPLTLISNPVQELLNSPKIPLNAIKNIQLIESNANRMIKLVNQVLDFRKIQEDKMRLVIEKFDIVPYLTKIANEFSLLAKEKEITYSVVHESNTCIVYSDKDKIEKITFNLLSNAFKFTPKNKKITICTNNNNGLFIIRVIDEGIGIHKKKLTNIFERFETIVNNKLTKPSTGIGLSLIKEFTAILHGTIEVSSIVGKGSEFKLSIPVSRASYSDDAQVEYIIDDSETNTLETFTDNISDNQGRISVLIVEDNMELLHFMKDILKDQFNIFLAINGKEGLDKAKQIIPDLIITDVMMPVMDGMEMIENIKDDLDICHIPIIILSAKNSLEDRIKGIAHGIDDYLPKPFNSKYLKAKVQGLIDQRKKLKDYYLKLYNDNRNELETKLDFKSRSKNNSSDTFIKRVMEFIEQNIEQPDIKINDFAKSLSLSRTVFYRKLKTIIGLSPIEFVMAMRIKKAVQYIKTNEYTIAEIAYMTGFNEPQYFSKCFKKQMGLTPTDYKKQMVNNSTEEEKQKFREQN